MAMAQTEKPTPLFVEDGIEVVLKKEPNREIYLTHVALYAPTNLESFWGSRIDNEEFLSMGVKFTLYYRYKRVYISKKADAQEGSKSYSELSAVAHFCEDTIGQEVFQAEFLDNWFLWELVPNFEGGMHWIPVPTTFEAAKATYQRLRPHDNEELLPLKVWRYVQKQQSKTIRKKKRTS